MKIAVDARLLELPEPTGVERAFQELLSALPQQLGPDDDVYALVRKPLSCLPDGVQQRVVAGSASHAVWRETALVKELKRRDYAVLWSPVEAIPIRTDVPTIATFYEAPWMVRRGLEGWRATCVHRVRTRLAARHARRIVCASHVGANQFARLYPQAESRLRVLPLGVAGAFRPDAFVPAPAAPDAEEARRRADSPYFLHVGGDRPRKNVPLLFDAYRRYREDGGTTRLLLVGPGGQPRGLPRGATWLGYVSDRRLRALYDETLALVISSASEGFGLPVLEAMACGAPVIATRAGSLAEVAGDAALLVKSGDAVALARALATLTQDPAQCSKLAARGRQRAAAATFGRAADGLLGIFHEAVLQ
jgi:glycosyltransferase involved in cell wall biosynthesis